MFVIYRIFVFSTQMSYIGRTIQLVKKRVFDHINDEHGLIGPEMIRVGKDGWMWHVLDTAETYEEAEEKERYWIKKYNCQSPNGYNGTDGGTHGYTLSPDRKEIVSQKAFEREARKRRERENQL